MSKFKDCFNRLFGKVTVQSDADFQYNQTQFGSSDKLTRMWADMIFDIISMEGRKPKDLQSILIEYTYSRIEGIRTPIPHYEFVCTYAGITTRTVVRELVDGLFEDRYFELWSCDQLIDDNVVPIFKRKLNPRQSDIISLWLFDEENVSITPKYFSGAHIQLNHIYNLFLKYFGMYQNIKEIDTDIPDIETLTTDDISVWYRKNSWGEDYDKYFYEVTPGGNLKKKHRL